MRYFTECKTAEECLSVSCFFVASSVELYLAFKILYIAISERYTVFRPNFRSKGDIAMDMKAVGRRIKMAREEKNLTQEDLASLVDISSTHISVIERGLKVVKLDTFVAIANALEVSADTLLIDVVEHSVTGVANELSDTILKLPKKEQKRVINVIKAVIE